MCSGRFNPMSHMHVSVGAGRLTGFSNMTKELEQQQLDGVLW